MQPLCIPGLDDGEFEMKSGEDEILLEGDQRRVGDINRRGFFYS